MKEVKFMACRDTIGTNNQMRMETPTQVSRTEDSISLSTGPFYFGVDSATRADTVLQNNLTLFDWVTRNKMYPNYWGRYIGGEKNITHEELDFLHQKGCKVAFIYNGCVKNKMTLEQQGVIDGKNAAISAIELKVPENNVIFLEVNPMENVTDAYLKGFAESLIQEGYAPGFCANTDSHYDFDHQFSRGYQNNPEIFGQCLIWAVSPSIPEYYRTTDTHMVYPDTWTPFCPSGMTQNQIAIWQYGRECHPILDHSGNTTSFDISIIQDASILLNKLF